MTEGRTPPEGLAQLGVGVPDAFGRLWTPHRLAYIKGGAGDEGCPFCVVPSLDDGAGMVVLRGEAVYAVLNLYPYPAGHRLIVASRPVPAYDELTAAEPPGAAPRTTQPPRRPQLAGALWPQEQVGVAGFAFSYDSRKEPGGMLLAEDVLQDWRSFGHGWMLA